MKLKKIFNHLLVAFFVFQFLSCDNKESLDSPFNATPSERLNAQQKELNNLLESAQYGWKAVYFTDTTQLGGYTHLFKFKQGKVDMASDFDSDTGTYSSEYSIELGSTVSLVFTTKNRIHLLSDSNNYPIASLRGKGYKGDFQFLYYGKENDQIIFKTNRSFKELRFVKATADDWSNLAKNIAMIPNVIGSNTRPLFRLLETFDGSKTSQFDFNFTEATRYATANSIESGSNMTSNIGIAYTPTGIIVSPPVKVGNQKLTDFTYDSASGAFTATGTNNITATIKYSNKPLIITNDYKKLLDGNPQTSFGYISAFLSKAPTNSPLCISLLNAVNGTLPANQNLSRIQLNFNTPFGNYIEYRFAGGKKTIYHNISTAENSTNKTIVLTHDSWESNGVIIPEPAFLKEIDAELMDPNGLYVKKENFNIQFSNAIYTFTSFSNPFRITTYAL